MVLPFVQISTKVSLRCSLSFLCSLLYCSHCVPHDISHHTEPPGSQREHNDA